MFALAGGSEPCSDQSLVLVRAARASNPTGTDVAWAKIIHDDRAAGVSTEKTRLVVDDSDLLDPSDAVDPPSYATEEARGILASGGKLFGGRDLQHARASPISRNSCAAKLVVRQLRVRRVVFHDDVQSGRLSSPSESQTAT